MSIKQKFIDLVLRGRDLFSKDASKVNESLKALQAESKAAADELKTLEKSQADILKARGLELYAEQAEKALAGARNEVARLAREIDASEKPTKEQAEALKLAGRSANQLQTEYNKLSSQLSRAKGDLQQAGINTDRLADEQNRLQTEIQQSATALSDKRAKLRDMRNALQQTEKSTESFGSKIGGATRALAGFIGAYVGLSKLRDGLVSILSTADQLESYSFQFAALFGGIEQGEQATAWVKQFAQESGTRLGNVRDAFVRLKTFGIDPMNGSLQALVDYNAKLGGSQEKLEGIILAVGQAWGKQKLQGEEILQLVERGVPVWDLLAQATGKSTAELQKLSTAGQLGREAIAALITELGNASTGMAKAGLDRLGGQINVAANNWERFQQLIADSGLYQTAVSFLKDLNAQFEAMASNGQLQKAAQDISNFFSSLITSGGSQLKEVISNINAFIAAINAVSGVVQIAFNAFTAGINTLAAGFTNVLGEMANAYCRFLEVIGADDLSRSVANTAEFLKDLSAAYVAAVEKDSQDMAAAWNRFTGNVNTSTAESFTNATATITAETEKQKSAINGLTEAEQARAAQQAELAQIMAKANITTIGSLEELQAAAQATYNAVSEGAAQGVATSYELEQAFLKWAEATVKVAAANKTAVPETLRLQAAQLGLERDLDSLITKQGLSLELNDKQSRSSAALRTEIDKTRASIDFYKRTIESSTSSLEEKRLATLRLYEAEQILKGQAEALLQVEQLKTKNYFEVQRALEAAKLQAEQITQAYTAGTITTEQYNNQLQRQITLIQILQGLMPDVNNETEDHGVEQDKTRTEVDKTTESVKEQATELDKLKDKTEKATQYTSLLAGAQAYLRKEFDFSGTSSQDLGKRYDELSGFIMQNRRAHNEWWRELANASNTAFAREQQIISETLRVREFTDTLQSSGVTMEQIRRIQATLNYGFTELGDNDLAPLRNAIADAERRIISLRDGLAGTVSSLQDELDALRDNQGAIEKRRYEQQLAELKAQLAAAQNAGDQQAIKSAQQALDLAKQIYTIKTQQIAAEKQANTNDSQQSTVTKAQPRPATQSPVLPESPIISTSGQQPANTVRVELALPSGKVFATYASQSNAASLMAELEQIRSTSL